MGYIGTYDGTIFHNPLSHYAVIIIKTDDRSIPAHARSDRRYPDHLIRFTAVGYDLPLTDAVDMELEGEWVDSKHGPQLKVEQCQERIKPTTEGIQGYLASGLIKGIGEKTAQAIVARFGMDSLTILEHHPERLLEIKGITPEKLEDMFLTGYPCSICHHHTGIFRTKKRLISVILLPPLLPTIPGIATVGLMQLYPPPACRNKLLPFR